jgi:hypothetical protein
MIYTMNPCDCSSRREYFDIHPDYVNEFLDAFEQLTEDRMEEYHLYRCGTCQSLWIVDERSRGPMAVRVSTPSEIDNFDERPYRRTLLIEMHGGLDEKECMFRGCAQMVMKGCAFCVDHVYPQFSLDGGDQ